jgi:hypothetical protein
MLRLQEKFENRIGHADFIDRFERYLETIEPGGPVPSSRRLRRRRARAKPGRKGARRK